MLLFALIACRVEFGPSDQRVADGRPTVWIYTALYQEQVDAFGAAVRKELPDIDVQWFQGGSEKVAQRWEAEHAAGASPACVLLTSDPSWYVDLTERGLLREYVPPLALQLPRDWVEPTFVTTRVDLMVIGVRPGAKGPASFHELADPAFVGQWSSGDPFSSGTNFTTVSALDQKYGQEFLESLDANGWMMAGGNSAVLGRIESAERPIGVVLLNNLLLKPGVADIVFPSDGAVPIPGPAAIPTDCREVEAAERVEDWLLGPTAQALVVHSRMHSPFTGAPAPEGAPPLDAIRLMDLGDDFIGTTAARAVDLRERLTVLQK